ncbi:hypothetical protein U1Q18_003882, partial [Sarracenia purpurea var. burkii]
EESRVSTSAQGLGCRRSLLRAARLVVGKKNVLIFDLGSGSAQTPAWNQRRLRICSQRVCRRVFFGKSKVFPVKPTTQSKDLGSAKVLDHRTATTFAAASARLIGGSNDIRRLQKKLPESPVSVQVEKLPANKEESGERSDDSRRPQFRRWRGFQRCVQAQGLASLV